MEPATPPARLVLESCPLPGGPSGRGRARRKWARMRSSLAMDADPRGRAAPTRRETTTPSILGAPGACAFRPLRPFVSPPGAEFGMACRQRGPRGVLC